VRLPYSSARSSLLTHACRLLSFCTKAAQEEALVRLKGLDIYGAAPAAAMMRPS
jgi:hypothetical protein